jgi:predicted dehydrogenase
VGARAGGGVSSRSPDAVIVGAGLMGRWHADAARRAGGRVVGVVDPDAARGAALATASGGRSFASLAAALEATASDVVHICTPLATHTPLAMAALGAGRHVVLEKPVAATADETARLLEAAASAGRLLVPVHQFVWQRGVQALLAEVPTMGRLRRVEIITCSAGAAGEDDAAHDRIAAEILPHPLSLMSALLPGGLPEADWAVQHAGPGEVQAAAVVRGTVVSLAISMHARPTLNQLRVMGERGSAMADLFHGYVVREAPEVSRARKVVRPFTSSAGVAVAALRNLAHRQWSGDAAYPGLRELLERSYAAMAGEATPPFSPAEILEVARAGDTIISRAQLA